MSSRTLPLKSEINLLWLADQLGDSLPNDELITFIKDIDARVGEMDFTLKLYAALGDVIRDELGPNHVNEDYSDI